MTCWPLATSLGDPTSGSLLGCSVIFTLLSVKDSVCRY
jgi:hypothetical protein